MGQKVHPYVLRIGFGKNWQSNLGWGFLVLVLAFPAFIILMLTGIGIHLALILMVLFFLTLYVSKLFVGMAIGKKLATYFPEKKFKDSIGV